MIILILLMFALIVGVIVFIIKSAEPKEVPPTQEEIDALTKEAEEVLLQQTIRRAKVVCCEAKMKGAMGVQAVIACADYDIWKESGASEELHNTAVWLRDKYICRNLDNGKQFFLFDYYDYEDIDRNFDAYANNPANRAQLEAMYKQVYDSFNISE